MVGDGLVAASVGAYDSYIHELVFGPKFLRQVRSVVADMHEKVFSRFCSSEEFTKRKDRPSKGVQAVKGFNHGWCMMVDADTCRI